MTFFPNLSFNPRAGLPLYQQLYSRLRVAILSGKLKGGLKLPSTRSLADELNISRNTVLNAYEQLLAEGYLESVEGSGTFVARVLPDFRLTPTAGQRRKLSHTPPAEASRPRFSANARSQLAVPQLSPTLPGLSRAAPRPFSFGMPALEAFPHKLWSQLVARRAKRIPSGAFTYQDAAGHGPLREAIAAHVILSRQIHCTPEQIIIVSGAQGALDLAARMLINAGDRVWMEDPGYFGARGALLGAGAEIVGSSRVDLQACKLEYSIVSPK